MTGCYHARAHLYAESELVCSISVLLLKLPSFGRSMDNSFQSASSLIMSSCAAGVAPPALHFDEHHRPAPNLGSPARAFARGRSAALARRPALGLSRRAGLDQALPGCARAGWLRSVRERRSGGLLL